METPLHVVDGRGVTGRHEETLALSRGQDGHGVVLRNATHTRLEARLGGECLHVTGWCMYMYVCIYVRVSQ